MFLKSYHFEQCSHLIFLSIVIEKFNYRSYYQQLDTMAYTARLTKQQLRQRRVTRRVIDHVTIGKGQYLVTYAYTNNNCLLCASNIIVSVAIPTGMAAPGNSGPESF